MEFVRKQSGVALLLTSGLCLFSFYVYSNWLGGAQNPDAFSMYLLGTISLYTAGAVSLGIVLVAREAFPRGRYLPMGRTVLICFAVSALTVIANVAVPNTIRFLPGGEIVMIVLPLMVSAALAYAGLENKAA